jgi:hypothetical protein
MAEIENGKAKNNWVPKAFQKSAQTIARDAVKQFVKTNQVIGLGSGPMAADIIREIGKLSSNVKETLSGNLTIVDQNRWSRSGGFTLQHDKRWRWRPPKGKSFAFCS